MDLAEALLSRSPGDAAALALFGQFVGAWDVDVIYYAADGSTETRAGEWVFGWALEGRAVQDVWRVPSRAESRRTGAPLHGYGTTLRFLDAETGFWRSTWHGVVKNEVIVFSGAAVGDEIHLDHAVSQEERRRWSFFAIERDRFRWRNERSTDRGRSWTLEQEMRARRKG
jgi:hypothetical protein